MNKSKNLFEIVKTTFGVTSIRNNQVNETMHAPLGPWREANELYIEQSKLKQRLEQNKDDEFVIYDVGLGAAANALAAIHCAKQSSRPMRLISFEIDMRLLQFAREHSEEFDHFKGYEKAIDSILVYKIWRDDNLVWELFEGDFLNCIDEVTHKCHLVFYDPYSSTQNQEMWTTDCFKKLRGKCHDDATFFNYSQATPVRAALLQAGFFVGYGKSIGYKEATTQAACRLEDLDQPLDERWFQRWSRSGNPLPPFCVDAEELKRAIRQHEQFRDLKK